MNKISVIIKREYITRVRKKSFIVMTLVAPLLMAALILLPTVLMTGGSSDIKRIAVVEQQTDLFRGKIRNTEGVEFVYIDNASLESLKDSIAKKKLYGALFIFPEIITTPNAIHLVSEKQPPISLISHIEQSLEKEIETQKLQAYNISNLDNILKDTRTEVSLQTMKIDETGAVKDSSTEVAMILAYISGLLMYMLVFLFGSQVMRGVIEEKTSRVVEVIISSVKPIELMLGKITGIALVGLTQFLIWVVLTATVANLASASFARQQGIESVQAMPQNIMAGSSMPAANSATIDAAAQNAFSEILGSAMNQPWALIVFAFIFYFIGGYLLYASVFAAIGSAVDNETETQQFMLPVSIPVIVALMVAIGTMQNPESPLAFWCSMIPLTSPVVMMARIPFGVPGWQIAVSMAILALTFAAFVWMAAKIYRTGILMYGKKTSWKEMWKWLRYSG
ncbi:MAG: ABC transporter permease [Bacteroidales bacterium]|jgi:ABC-2 type transport system permease protein|nr:ABC transporter permease [Bacteroidales bacterium]